jgi:hypothetical protein
MEIAGVDYNLPGNNTFSTPLLNNSYFIGKNVGMEFEVGTIGRRIVSLELKNILG